MGASASASPLGEGLRSSIAGGTNGAGGALSAEHSISWSFLDENGVHEVELFHGTADCLLFVFENCRIIDYSDQFGTIHCACFESAPARGVWHADALAGTRRALLNGCIVGASKSFSPFEAGDVYTFQAGRHRCTVHAKPDAGQFHYSMSVDGVAIAEFNQRLWSHCTRWFFNIDQV
jgi:hypothetical protein